MAQTTPSFTQPKRGTYISFSAVSLIQRMLPPADLTTPILTSGLGSPTLGYFCSATEGCKGRKSTIGYLGTRLSSIWRKTILLPSGENLGSPAAALAMFKAIAVAFSRE